MKTLKDISYDLVRSRRRTADIIIEPDGKVVVRAPEDVSEEKIEDIVEAKRLWIYKNLAEWRDLNATRVIREYRNGEGFLYLGRSYRLLLVSDQTEPVLLKAGRFRLRRDLVEETGVPAAKSAFVGYFVERGQQWISRRVAYFALKAGVMPARCAVRDLGARWASCSPQGNLAFHWKCMMAPPRIIDYIVVHELCHFHHLDHSQAFWNEVDKLLPDWRERKEWLRKNGAGMDL